MPMLSRVLTARALLVATAIAAVLPSNASAQLGTATVVPPPPVVIVPGTPTSRNGPVLVQPVLTPPATVLPAPPGGATAQAVPRGHFQLIARQFLVQHQTRDDALENDGPGDEIMLQSDAFRFDRRGVSTPEPPRRSGIIGAQDRWALVGGTAIPGFSARADPGGFKTCDSYPLRPGPVSAGPNLPMIVWDGFLQRGMDGVIVVPSLWEMEDRTTSPAQRTWATSLPTSAANQSGRMIGVIGGINIPAPISPEFLGFIPVFDDGNRPIGASTRNPFGSFPYLAHYAGMRIQSVVLTFDRAEAIAARAGGATSFMCNPEQIVNDGLPIPPGGFVMQFRDPAGNDGDYLLVMQLVRVG
jgi:hypothetical protein